MSLSTKLDEAREKMMKKTGSALDTLFTVAARLEMKETGLRFEAVKKNLESETFNLIVLGRFKNGKSTLMNALLGRLTHAVPELQTGKGPMPVDDLPCTATLTSINYAETPYVRVWGLDGKSRAWSLEKYLRESTVKDDAEETEKFFSNIRQFELGLPAELCRSGVTLVDSPGLDDVKTRTAITMEAVGRADAAIVVFRSDVLAGMTEVDFVTREVLGSDTRAFIVINLRPSYDPDEPPLNVERLKAHVWDKLVRPIHNGPKYSGQDLSAYDIYFVNARKAQRGKLAEDAALISESGIDLFEKRLGDFLLTERYHTHLKKHLKVADVAATTVEQQIDQRRAALKEDESKLQEAYRAIQPQLAIIRERRDHLPPIFKKYRKDAKSDLATSIRQLFKQIREDLPGEIEGRSLPTIEKGGVFVTFHQKKICQEAVELCNQVINERLTAWGSNKPPAAGARESLDPILDNLFAEVSDEVAQIDRQFKEVHVKLTGWTPQSDAPTSVISMQERVISGAAGLLVGDFASVFGAGGGGWRSVAGNLGGQLAAVIVLSAVGLAGTVVFWPVVLAAGIAAGLVGSRIGLDKRAKKKALEAVITGLNDAPDQVTTKINDEVDKLFTAIETGVMKSVLEVIEDEERNIKKMVDLNKRSQEQKQKDLVKLNEASKEITVQRQALKQAVVLAVQVTATSSQAV
jgi:hypothetical protein